MQQLSNKKKPSILYPQSTFSPLLVYSRVLWVYRVSREVPWALWALNPWDKWSIASCRHTGFHGALSEAIPFLKKKNIGVQLIYCFVGFGCIAVKQLHIYICPLFQILFLQRSLHSTEERPLIRTASPYWLSSLCMCTCSAASVVSNSL